MGRPPRALYGLALLLISAGGCKGEEFEGSGQGGSPGDSGGTSTGGTGATGTGGTAEPADVSGTYTVAITNGTAQSSGAASCPLVDWMEGATSTGVGITIMQNGTAVQGQIDGATGLAVWAVLGTASFSGSVSGNDVHMVIFGTKMYMEGTCTYTFSATTDATLAGDAMSGTTVYTPVLGADPACEGIACTANQRFSGSRPPR